MPSTAYIVYISLPEKNCVLPGEQSFYLCQSFTVFISISSWNLSFTLIDLLFIYLLLLVASLADLLIDLGEELPNGFHTGINKCFY